MMLIICNDSVTASKQNEGKYSFNSLLESSVSHGNCYLDCDAIDGPANRRSVSRSAVRNNWYKIPSNLEHSAYDNTKSLPSLLPNAI